MNPGTFDILIIDDEKVIIDAAIRICSDERLKVDAALDVNAALEKIKKNRYRLIICDIMLPGMDGFQFLKKLAQQAIATSVIMTTGYSTTEYAVKSLYYEAIDFLPKPFSMDEFCSTVMRGFKYEEIRQKKVQSGSDKSSSVLYVPCPSNYFRFGYGSWLKQESTGLVQIGLTDLFLKTIESLVSITLIASDRELVQGNPCATLECKNSVEHVILSPISGKILEKNKIAERDSSVVEKDPYSSGWLYKVIPSDLAYEMKYLIPCVSEDL